MRYASTNETTETPASETITNEIPAIETIINETPPQNSPYNEIPGIEASLKLIFLSPFYKSTIINIEKKYLVAVY